MQHTRHHTFTHRQTHTPTHTPHTPTHTATHPHIQSHTYITSDYNIIYTRKCFLIVRSSDCCSVFATLTWPHIIPNSNPIPSINRILQLLYTPNPFSTILYNILQSISTHARAARTVNAQIRDNNRSVWAYFYSELQTWWVVAKPIGISENFQEHRINKLHENYNRHNKKPNNTKLCAQIIYTQENKTTDTICNPYSNQPLWM